MPSDWAEGSISTQMSSLGSTMWVSLSGQAWTQSSISGVTWKCQPDTAEEDLTQNMTENPQISVSSGYFLKWQHDSPLQDTQNLTVQFVCTNVYLFTGFFIFVKSGKSIAHVLLTVHLLDLNTYKHCCSGSHLAERSTWCEGCFPCL